MSYWRSIQAHMQAQKLDDIPSNILLAWMRHLKESTELNPAGYDAVKSYDLITQITAILCARFESGKSNIDPDDPRTFAPIVPCGRRCGLCPECSAKAAKVETLRSASAPPGVPQTHFVPVHFGQPVVRAQFGQPVVRAPRAPTPMVGTAGGEMDTSTTAAVQSSLLPFPVPTPPILSLDAFEAWKLSVAREPPRGKIQSDAKRRRQEDNATV